MSEQTNETSEQPELLSHVTTLEERNAIAQAIIDNPMSSHDCVSLIRISAKFIRDGFGVEKTVKLLGEWLP